MNDNRIYETELINAITQLLIAVNEWEKHICWFHQ